MMEEQADEFAHHIGRLLQLALRDYAQRALVKLKAAGYDDLTQFQAELLSYIPPRGDRITELARRAGTSKQAIGEAVAQLEKAGYVEKTTDPRDTRATLVTFSARGRVFVKRVREVKRELDEEYTEALGKETFATLRRSLESMRGTPPERSSARPQSPGS
jgi:DNA-binding MarR family transcriptional regulator